MIRITDILDKIHEYQPDADLDIVQRAYIYSAKVHDGQVRLSGEPYLTHPLEVAGILADMKLDTVSIAAGLLHDVIEDSHATEEEIRDLFGPDVMHIVSGVTKLSVLQYEGQNKVNSSKFRQAESLRKMILAMADDIRVILIKLADRIHNMRTLQFHKSEAKKKQIAQETLDIYAPIAGRLGIYWIRKELEDTSFMYLMPEEYIKIRNLVNKDIQERESYIEEVKGKIREVMASVGLPCEVIGRYKHFYSIYNKMISQNLDFNQVYDIIAFRIILDTKSQCYEALGHIHSTWKPIDYKIKDYIARPKPNMYQSLHTTVFGPKNERIEIQIRTKEMDKVAKYGIAAHWSYKEGRPVDENICKKFAWIQNLVENQENIQDPCEFLENVRIDLFPDEIYVFTPTGEVKSLPKGSTPVDFAYMIHSEVGNQCTGAKINGRMMPLKYQLQTGDIVEIITSKDHQPSKDWLSFVKTVKARSKIKQWIKTQEKNRSIALGKEMCEKAFRKYRLNYAEAIKADDMQKVIDGFGFKTLDDLIAAVGYGKITPLQIVRRIHALSGTQKKEESFLHKIIDHVKKKKKTSSGVVVGGMNDILIRFGKCCLPIPGDPISGCITRGYGVTVHRAQCVNALNITSDRQIDVEWGEPTNETFPVTIHIRSHDRVGLLADLAANISKNNANIQNVKSDTIENNLVDTYFTLLVKDIHHLEKVMTDIKKVKHIMHVRRI